MIPISVNYNKIGKCYEITAEEISFTASSEDLYKYGLKNNAEFDECSLKEIASACAYSWCYNYAIKLLALRQYTAEGLRKKLLLKGFSEEASKAAVNKLSEYKYINDDEYVRKYVNDSINLKSKGMHRIKAELKAKGISSEILQKLYIDEDKVFEQAEKAAIKKLKIIKDPKKAREKLFRFLVTKGYEFDIVNRVIDKILNTSNEMEDW